MPVSIGDVADRDEIKDAKIIFKSPNGKQIKLDVSYFPNRLTTAGDADEDEPEDDDSDDAEATDAAEYAPAWDRSFCDFMAGWDVFGPVKTRHGVEVVAAGVAVPLDPTITKHVPLWFKQNVQAEILQREFPSQEKSRRSRRG